jgi:hypothetical protein
MREIQFGWIAHTACSASLTSRANCNHPITSLLLILVILRLYSPVQKHYTDCSSVKGDDFIMVAVNRNEVFYFLYFAHSLHVSASAGHLQVNTIDYLEAIRSL